MRIAECDCRVLGTSLSIYPYISVVALTACCDGIKKNVCQWASRKTLVTPRFCGVYRMCFSGRKKINQIRLVNTLMRKTHDRKADVILRGRREKTVT